MSEEFDENRLYQINTGGDRGGVPLWPVFVILVIGAAVMGALAFPCSGLRLDFMLNAPDDAPMSVFQMLCTGDGESCVCTQKASSVTGGKDCEVGTDLAIRCKTVSAEAKR